MCRPEQFTREINLSSKSNYSTTSSQSSYNELDPNHSHYLMYDHGSSTNQKQADNYRRMMFRFHFEAYLREFGNGGNGLPVVNILISGKLPELQKRDVKIHTCIFFSNFIAIRKTSLSCLLIQ